jgi:tetratricopeptide (TPR) repeat protein
MYPCPSCGVALPATEPPPPSCPRCGAHLQYEDDGFDPGAPPGFGGRPDESTEAPIFGLPGESSAQLLRPDSLAPLRRRQPPPPPPSPGVRTGPPSIGLDDVERHGELDLGSSAGSLELDLGAPRTRPAAEPPPAIGLDDDSGMLALEPPDARLDLPSPGSLSPGRVQEDSNAYALDLPAPVPSAPAPGLGRPATPTRPAAPARAAVPARSAAPPRAAAPPSGPGSSHGPSGARAGASGFARPAPPPAAAAPALPARAAPPRPGASARPPGPPAVPLSFDEDDLLAPVELDLPAPVADDRLDLPIPVDLAPPPPRGASRSDAGLTPVGLDVTPAQLGVAPTTLDVTPVQLDVTPSLAAHGVAPHDLPAPASGIAPPRPGQGGPHPGIAAPPGPGPAPGLATRAPASAGARTPVSRGVLIAAGGLLVLGLAGVGILYSGLLDPEEPEPAVLRSPRAPDAAKANDGTEASSPTPRPAGEVAERAPAVLATLARHTPAAYLEAMAASHAAGDAVGAAEAALLLALHYGPSPARATEAAALLEPHARQDAVFVTRVVGLSALVAGDHAAAEAGLAGDDPRAQLYRGWLRLAQGRLDDAKADADAVLSTLPDEVAARGLALAVQAQRDPGAALAAIEAALAKGPHPALHALLAATATAAGQLAVARAAVDAIDPEATDDAGVQAWAHAHKARVLAAQGDLDAALAAFDRALALVPQASTTSMDRIRTLVAARRFTQASTAVSTLVRERPQDLEARFLQAEVAIHGGDGDLALQVLDELGAARPEDARVPIGKGEVHAMRFEVDEGQAAFAAARALDPRDVRAAVAEAVLLADAKRLPDALARLETARAEAQAAGRTRDVATLLRAKAELHAKAGERNAALEALERALAAAPGDNEAQLRRGVLRLEAGQAAAGRADLIAVFERTGGYPGLAAPLGHLYVRDGDFEALERLVGDRLRGEGTADDLLTVGARLRLHQGRTADARALLELALVRRPADWEAHMLLAQVLILEGNATEALAEIERSRPPSPQPEQLLQRGKILEFNGRHDDAIPEYQRALAIDPELHEARFLYGRMLRYRGGHAKAVTELRKVADAPRAKAAPWYPEVWLNLGVAQEALGKHRDAIASLEEATTLDPKLGEAWAEAGKFHGYRNENAQAIAALERAIEVGPEDALWFADALIDLGRAQSKAGKRTAAKPTLERFLATAPADHTSRPEAERLLAGL